MLDAGIHLLQGTAMTDRNSLLGGCEPHRTIARAKPT
jgi:hypothetical protein